MCACLHAMMGQRGLLSGTLAAFCMPPCSCAALMQRAGGSTLWLAAQRGPSRVREATSGMRGVRAPACRYALLALHACLWAR